MGEFGKGKSHNMKKDKGKIEKALSFVRHGSYVKPAVIAAGLNYHTHLTRYSKGKKGLEPFVQYYNAFEEAKSMAEINHVESIFDSSMDGNVGAAQWLLSRKFPDRWGKKERIDLKQDNHQVIEFISHSDAQNEKEDKE